MATLTEIREAIRETVKANIPKLMVYDDVADVTQVPAVVVLPSRPSGTSGMVANFNGAFQRGMVTWNLDLYVLVARTDGLAAQKSLDSYISGRGERSVPNVLYTHPDLGLTDGTDANAEGIRDYGGAFEAQGISHVGAVIRVTVRTTG
jgi:hypothetical protein